jgi:hypothetical protein
LICIDLALQIQHGKWDLAGLKSSLCRFYTAMQLTREVLLLAGFRAGFLLNTKFIAPTLPWPVVTIEGASQNKKNIT